MITNFKIDFSDNAVHPFSSVGLDVVLNCAVRAREFLLPHLSFKDLFSLERTSKVLRDIIREKQVNTTSNEGSRIYVFPRWNEVFRFEMSTLKCPV